MASARQPPRHRRPSWMKDAETFRIHMTADFVREGSETPVTDTECYSYNKQHHLTWALDASLRSTLPPWLAKHLDDWSCAGAAVQTSLDRIARLDNEAMDRGWPERKSGHLSRATSNGLNSMCSPTPPSTATSPLGTSFSSESYMKKPKLANLHTELASPDINKSPHPDQPLSPPWTPRSSMPVIQEQDSAVALYTIDPMKLNERLIDYETTSPTDPSSPSPNLAPLSNTTPAFDQSAWERFLDEYKREMDGLQEDDTVRFRHLRRKIDLDYGVMADEAKLGMDDSTQEQYRSWWSRMGKDQKALEQQVNKVSLPKLDDIKHLRRVYELPV